MSWCRLTTITPFSRIYSVNLSGEGWCLADKKATSDPTTTLRVIIFWPAEVSEIDINVDIQGWPGEFKEGLRTRNKYYAVIGAAKNLYNGLFFSLTSRYQIATNIFSREWNLLLVLDACRVNAMREVTPEYEFTTTVVRSGQSAVCRTSGLARQTLPTNSKPFRIRGSCRPIIGTQGASASNVSTNRLVVSAINLRRLGRRCRR